MLTTSKRASVWQVDFLKVALGTAVIILLTPRDPAFLDKQNQESIARFVETRSAFVKAVQGTEEDMRRFKELYPDWNQISPNRLASHVFLMNNSELYRTVNGGDLLAENLDLLGKTTKKKKHD